MQPESIKALVGELGARVVAALGGAEAPAVTRTRHQDAIHIAYRALTRAEGVLVDGPEKAAEDVRIAIRVLQSVVGAVDHEAVLDRVFSSFCIGK
jgi:tRNA modification GTPase